MLHNHLGHQGFFKMLIGYLQKIWRGCLLKPRTQKWLSASERWYMGYCWPNLVVSSLYRVVSLQLGSSSASCIWASVSRSTVYPLTVALAGNLSHFKPANSRTALMVGETFVVKTMKFVHKLSESWHKGWNLSCRFPISLMQQITLHTFQFFQLKVFLVDCLLSI